MSTAMDKQSLSSAYNKHQTRNWTDFKKMYLFMLHDVHACVCTCVCVFTVRFLVSLSVSTREWEHPNIKTDFLPTQRRSYDRSLTVQLYRNMQSMKAYCAMICNTMITSLKIIYDVMTSHIYLLLCLFIFLCWKRHNSVCVWHMDIVAGQALSKPPDVLYNSQRVLWFKKQTWDIHL